MKMKKLAAVALAVVMSVSMLAGCGSSNDKSQQNPVLLLMEQLQ